MEKEKTYTVFLPPDRENRAPLFVSVNDRTWLIKRGESVEVPLCVKLVLDAQARSDADALLYEQNTSNG